MTATTTTPPPQTTEEDATVAQIPTPPNFPVTWKALEDARYFWMFDRMHVPEPMTPADGAYFHCAYEFGITAAARGYGLPLRALARRVNTYGYLALVPLELPPAEAE